MTSPGIKVYAHVPCERTERIVACYEGELVRTLPDIDTAVWLVADTQLKRLGAAHYKEFEYPEEFTLVVGPDTAIVQVPEGAMTVHIPTGDGRSMHADQALAIIMEYLYGTP